MIEPMFARTVVGGRRTATIEVVAAVVALSAVLLAALLAVPVGRAGASTPPVPAGSVRSSLARPLVYPGSGVDAFGDAGTILAEDAATIDTVGTGASEDATAFAAGALLNSPVVAMVTTAGDRGYWLAGADGAVYAFGDAALYGSLGNLTLQAPIVGMAATPNDAGYWLVGLDGGVFAFGDATFYGSMGGQPMDEPVVGVAATPTGGGYWLVAADGGVFAFGDAKFYGSMGGQPLVAAVTGMAAVPGGGGYWLVAGDGGVFSFGDAQFYGSMAGQALNAGVVGMAVAPGGAGYWLLGWDGGVFVFGDAAYAGSAATSAAAAPFVQIVPTADGLGYWLLEPDGFDYGFANPPPNGTFPGSSAIVAAAQSQVQPDPSTGYFCNPYGPCEEWCALFATWAWQQGGVPIPSYGFTGDIYTWAAYHGAVLPPTAVPVPGDAVLYGTGPNNTATSVHVGIVAQVWPDGAIVTIEGDAGPGDVGHLAVLVNGPFLPADSDWYNGFGIYAFAQP
jgi:hypothetical protein